MMTPCHYAECRYAECQFIYCYAECRCAECQFIYCYAEGQIKFWHYEIQIGAFRFETL